MGMLHEFKQYAPSEDSVENMMTYHAFGVGLSKSYTDFGLEPPDWLVEKLAALGREIKVKQRDELERELKKAELALDSLKTAEEKRGDLRAKIERLKAKL